MPILFQNSIMIKVAINGFGRIGRNTLRSILKRPSDIELVAINDLAESHTLAHLFKYDSVHGPFAGEVYTEDGYLVIDGRKILTLKERSEERRVGKECRSRGRPEHGKQKGQSQAQ